MLSSGLLKVSEVEVRMIPEARKWLQRVAGVRVDLIVGP
jgi:hypothetical protein